MQVFKKHRFACLMVAQAFEDCDPDAAGPVPGWEVVNTQDMKVTQTATLCRK